MRFQNKVVLVTGGASGQGKAACQLFAAEGANVIVADWNKEGAQAVASEIGGVAFHVNVAHESQVKAMIEFTMARFNQLDVLLNNAGVGLSESGRYPMSSVVDTTEDTWDAIMAINLKGAAMACKHAIPIMVDQGMGIIINIASIHGLVGVGGVDAYAASKGGMIALTRALACDWARKGLRVNCICPGAVDTPMINIAAFDQQIDEMIRRNVPMRRKASAEELARVSVFLASSDASYLNGAIIPVDGGWTAH